ncbi:hypothetical protein ATO67_16445 [Agrobacterium bohemicum]|uniref:Transposase n=1 Tax=Agrobacterium bohemicum TaxID=2052828 RepID=A0A135P978_9HYPH|nr:hypothetical protein ATO67_16445 [Agrobacterium bohemicum]
MAMLVWIVREQISLVDAQYAQKTPTDAVMTHRRTDIKSVRRQKARTICDIFAKFCRFLFSMDGRVIDGGCRVPPVKKNIPVIQKICVSVAEIW